MCEISAAIKDYALPIFELFEDKQKAVEFMTQRGTKFNKNLSAFDLYPIYFVYCQLWRDSFFLECLNASNKIRKNLIPIEIAARAALLSYNGDDCRATAAVRRFLAAGAPGLPSMADFA